MTQRRITRADLDKALQDLKQIGQEMDIEGAEYWVVENPFGPTGLHFLERHHDDGNWVSRSTKLGHYTWSGPKEAHAALRYLWNALHAARRSYESGDRHSAVYQAGTL